MQPCNNGRVSDAQTHPRDNNSPPDEFKTRYFDVELDFEKTVESAHYCAI